MSCHSSLLLVLVARKLRNSHPQALLFQFHSSMGSPLFSYFSAALRRTALVPCQCRTPRLRFSTLSFVSTQNHLEYPFEILGQRTIDNSIHDPVVERGFLESIKRASSQFPTEREALAFLDESEWGSIKSKNHNLVCSLVWELREDWKLALLAFKWGQKRGCVDEGDAFVLVVWVLGSQRKFNTAWVLIRDVMMHRSSISMNTTRRAMLVMIDRYAAANYPGKVVWTFHIMEKFRLAPDEEAFYSLLKALCKYGNIEEAEEFMFVNKKLFPVDVEGFNIILNGWCNIWVDVLEAKRVWREMSKCCISPNATSYTYMISCFSKVGNLFDSLRLYDETKKRGWTPGLEVYNSLIYVLTRENCFNKALNILDKMKEAGVRPDSTTYNSMIRPLCEANMLDEASKTLATMIEDNLSPTTETYHAFLGAAGFEGTLEILNRMRIAGLGPSGHTFLLILAKFFKLNQPDTALKVWVEMKVYEIVPELTHYTVLVEGLARCGLSAKAREFYAEMRSNGFADDPRLLKILKEPTQDQNSNRKQGVRHQKNEHDVKQKGGSMVGRKRNLITNRKKKSLFQNSASNIYRKR